MWMGKQTIKENALVSHTLLGEWPVLTMPPLKRVLESSWHLANAAVRGFLCRMLGRGRGKLTSGIYGWSQVREMDQQLLVLACESVSGLCLLSLPLFPAHT